MSDGPNIASAATEVKPRLTARELFGLERPCDLPGERPLSPVAAECLLAALEAEQIRQAMSTPQLRLQPTVVSTVTAPFRLHVLLSIHRAQELGCPHFAAALTELLRRDVEVAS